MNPFKYLDTWFGRGRERRQPFPVETNATWTPLEDLPSVVRMQIWAFLDPKDYRTIRLLCRTFKIEIERHGMNVHLEGSKPWSGSELSSFLALVTPAKPIEEKLAWIANTKIQSLTMSRLNGIPPDRINLRRSEQTLEKLFVRLDEDMGPKAALVKILIQCNNLRIIDLSCSFCPIELMLLPRDLHAREMYRKEAIRFTKEILKTLPSKPFLKELNISVEIDELKRVEFQQALFVGTPKERISDQFEYPNSLQILNINLPIFKNSDDERCELTSWKALLDQQTQLAKLNVNLGFVYWTYFVNVIHKNAGPLQELSLCLSNWPVVRTQKNWNASVHEKHLFCWSILLASAHNLTSLKVSMSSHALRYKDLRPHKTLNFASLPLVALETLELVSVRLCCSEFSKIFCRIPTLKKVSLTHWSTVGLQKACLITLAGKTLTFVFTAMFSSTHLERIVLRDMCVNYCPKHVRELMNAAVNYVKKWPKLLRYVEYRDFQLMLANELTINRKPLEQLIEPLITLDLG